MYLIYTKNLVTIKKKIILNQLVSVALATYNGAKYLSSQLDSILKQNYKNIEIIIVDDASSDNTLEIIESYQQTNKNITLYKNDKNLGLLRTFEKAINLSSGDFIALCDQDDIWLPNKIEILLHNIGENLLIHSDAKLINADNNIIGESHFALAKRKDKSGFIDYLVSNNVTGCTCMFSNKLKELAVPFPEYFYSHDHYLALVASYYGTIKLLDEPLILYRQHGNNVIGAKRPNFENFFLECKKKFESYDAMLALPQFSQNQSLQLFRDYRYAIYKKKSLSRSNSLKLLKLKNGYKLFVYYGILVFTPKIIAKFVYNTYIKFKYHC